MTNENSTKKNVLLFFFFPKTPSHYLQADRSEGLENVLRIKKEASNYIYLAVFSVYIVSFHERQIVFKLILFINNKI